MWGSQSSGRGTHSGRSISPVSHGVWLGSALFCDLVSQTCHEPRADLNVVGLHTSRRCGAKELMSVGDPPERPGTTVPKRVACRIANAGLMSPICIEVEGALPDPPLRPQALAGTCNHVHHGELAERGLWPARPAKISMMAGRRRLGVHVHGREVR